MKTRSNITEKMLTGTLRNKSNKNILRVIGWYFPVKAYMSYILFVNFKAVCSYMYSSVKFLSCSGFNDYLISPARNLFPHASGESSGQTAQVRSLNRAFACSICGMYKKLIC